MVDEEKKHLLLLSPFRIYDVRGVIGVNLTYELIEKIGVALSQYWEEDETIGIGRDVRLHSPNVFSSLTRGIQTKEKNVINFGVITTGIANFIAWRRNIPVVMITASHNPPEWNGLKFFHKGGKEFSPEELKKLEDKTKQIKEIPKGRKGAVMDENVLPEYKDYIRECFDIIGEYRVGFDPANGCGGVLLDILEETFKVYGINLELDGTFPAHIADPSYPENLEQLRDLVKKENLDFGVAMDTDCDRFWVVWENGRIVPSIFVAYLFAKYLLKGGDNILVNFEMPFFVESLFEQLGVNYSLEKVGYPFMKEGARRKRSLLFAGYSGHFGFRENNYSDDALYALFRFISMIEEMEIDVNTEINNFPQYFEKRIEFEIIDHYEAYERVRAYVDNYKIGDLRRELDGLGIYFGRKGRILIRPSNTEALLRIKVEADSIERVNSLRDTAVDIIYKSIPKERILKKRVESRIFGFPRDVK